MGVEGPVVYTPQEEDAQRRSRRPRANGYRPGLTPGNLVKVLAKGQSSTDLNGAEEREPFGVLLSTILAVPATTAASCGGGQETLAVTGTRFSTLSPRFRVAQVRGEKKCH
jgi:hypothetical protein